MIKVLLIRLFFFLLIPTVEIPPTGEAQPVNAFEFLIDRDNSFTIDQVISNADFETIFSPNPNFGINKQAVWLRFSIKIDAFYDKQPILVVDNPTLDEVHFFLVANGEVINSQASGLRFKYEDRLLATTKNVFDIELGDNQEAEIYLKILNSDQKIVTVFISNRLNLLERLKVESLLFGIFSGVLIGLFFYNLFLFLSIKDITYLIYVIHTLMVWFAQSSLLGYTQELFWPNWEWMNVRSIVIFSSFVSIAGIWFLREFLLSRNFVPKLDRGFDFIYTVYAAILFNAVFLSVTLSYQILLVTQAIVVPYVLIVAVSILKQGYRPARFYLLAWAVFMIGLFTFILIVSGVIPYTENVRYIMPFGSALEVILLSFALADRISTLETEREKEQYDKLRILKENEMLIIEQKEVLEDKVKKRTMELEEILSNLQNTQTQLVNQEKMASLGQLTAGIAHEINNPINFVSSNISPLRRDINDLLEIVEAYREKGDVEFSEDSKKEISGLEEEIEFDYIITEIEQLLKGMEEGAKRTVEIVKGLRLFSRVDEQDVKKVDIHDGINSTLVLLNSTMAGKVNVVKEYGQLPVVECLAGKMNQVFMNILTNAVHAMLDNLESNPEPTITIKTYQDGPMVKIEIGDNGPGMPAKVKERIFEPFFTTKAVGKGTGLGLSIVYTIIEKHKGKLEVQTEERKGTNFIITIPIYQTTPEND